MVHLVDVRSSRPGFYAEGLCDTLEMAEPPDPGR